MSAERDTTVPPRRGGFSNRLKRVALLTGMALATVNVWTGSPLLGLWIGSRVQGSGPPRMGAILAAFATIAVLSLVLVRLINVMRAAYDEETGRGRGVRRQVPWLRSMRGERPNDPGPRRAASPADAIVVVCVVLAVIAFEIWFFFLSGSPIGGSSTRG